MPFPAIPPGEEPRSIEVFAESGGNTEWVAERSSYKCQLRTHARTRIRMDTNVSVVFYLGMGLYEYLCSLPSISLSCNIN